MSTLKIRNNCLVTCKDCGFTQDGIGGIENAKRVAEEHLTQETKIGEYGYLNHVILITKRKEVTHV